jgi:hypothetical protein
VQKVNNAQGEGAKMAIIMDDRVEKTENLIMISDGNGGSSNPTKPVILSIKFETNITDRVQVTLSLDSNNRASYKFLR